LNSKAGTSQYEYFLSRAFISSAVISLVGLTLVIQASSNTFNNSFLVLFDSFLAAKSQATNLSNSFLEDHDILLMSHANSVFAFVLNKYFQANAHTAILPNLPHKVSLSKGHTLYQAAPHIADLLNTDNISLAASAESFLDIASSRAFDI
jgi:hypothetical protein